MTIFRVLLLALACLPSALWSQTRSLESHSSEATTKTELYAEFKGQRLYYRISGLGPNLLLLHGGLNSSECFQKIIPVLAKSFRVISVDRGGHGRSSDSGEPFSYQAMAEETKAFLESLGIQSTFVLGWSDGGIVGYH